MRTRAVPSRYAANARRAAGRSWRWNGEYEQEALGLSAWGILAAVTLRRAKPLARELLPLFDDLEPD